MFCRSTSVDRRRVEGTIRSTVEPADLDGDGLVTAEDLTILLSNWGGSGEGDINSDGTIDAEDLTALLSAWSA